MRGSSSTKRQLTTSGDLDQRVFALSSDGRQLLFTRAVAGAAGLNNELWLIPDTTAQEIALIRLTPTNILYAEWVPQNADTISYSTAEPRETAPGWQALNDLWVMRIDTATGDAITAERIVEPSAGGLYGWWGTRFQWSPDGTEVACVRADSVGIVDIESGQCIPLLNYAWLDTSGDWSWRATLSWSPDGSLLATTVHGLPVGQEAPENSPAFHIAITNTSGEFNANIVQNAGIWSAPRYSPEISAPGSIYPTGYLAYLRAREWNNSVNDLAQYDLVVADRDGSNARVVFPEDGQAGLTARGFAQDYIWNPIGTQIALIYQGNLWVVNVETGVAQQLTLDGGASKPSWSQ
jgi:hypothetical protein